MTKPARKSSTVFENSKNSFEPYETEAIEAPARAQFNIRQAQPLDPGARAPYDYFPFMSSRTRHPIAKYIKLLVVGAVCFAAYKLNVLQLAKGYVFRDLKEIVNKLKDPQVAADFEMPTKEMATVPSTEMVPDTGTWLYDAKKFDGADPNSYGTLHLSTSPAANIVLIDSKRVVDADNENIQTPLRDFRLPPGNYVFSFFNTTLGFTSTQQVVVKAAAADNLTFLMRRR